MGETVETMNAFWLIAVLIYLAGVATGLGGYFLYAGPRSERGKLESQLKGLKADFKTYQDNVTGHFDTTAQLVNRLTESYRDVHEHLATGAETLCEGDEVQAKLGDSLLASSALLSSQESKPKRRGDRPTPLEQPLDYAEKKAVAERSETASLGTHVPSKEQVGTV